jgi:hypothetical protein
VAVAGSRAAAVLLARPRRPEPLVLLAPRQTGQEYQCGDSAEEPATEALLSVLKGLAHTRIRGILNACEVVKVRRLWSNVNSCDGWWTWYGIRVIFLTSSMSKC